ncbi:Uncharacterized conserved protein [Cognatiyoonia koreensis]|uniref:Uncharacterized conserved protein n=2 Tax=Cognatiyoonia koreensis TaxID=364200 RepID=A0A1I0PDX2_9RHOB|nr:Uncharacterized conserved protein [Cognatiyoonia koreensis]
MIARPIQIPSVPKFLRCLVVLAISAFCMALLWGHIRELNGENIRTLFTQISLGQWICALGATICSFFALGQYDTIWHKVLKTRVPACHAHRTGICAIAIGQAIGLTAVTAGLVRWRQLRGLQIEKVIALSAAVSTSFMLCWALLLAPAFWVVGKDISSRFDFSWTLIPGLALGACLFIWLSVRKSIQLRLSLALLFWTAVDLVFAGLVVVAFLPDGTPVVPVIAAVMIATGAGLISNAPGGLGAFDLTLFAMLPNTPDESLVAALIAYRMTYVLLPFILALLVLVKARPPVADLRLQMPAAWGLARQSGFVASGSNWSAHIAETAVGLVALGNALGPNRTAAKQGIRAFYKCSPNLAAELRQCGWTSMRIALEAQINPQAFSITGRDRQSLRRKLRKAEAAGISCTEETCDKTTMSEIAESWAKEHGGEMGFSMGRFSQDYIKHQRIFIIRRDQIPIGFVTFHHSKTGWSLDLIRYVADTPCGAIYLAIETAIATARDDGVTNLCLGAVPSFTGQLQRLNARRAGLMQFKQSFGPTWRPVYHAASNPIWFCLTAVAIAWEIHRPIQNLRYQRFVMKIMRCFQLRKFRARGIAADMAAGTQTHGRRAQQTS